MRVSTTCTLETGCWERAFSKSYHFRRSNMRYYYEDATQGRVGPYTLEELRQLHLNGTVQPDTIIVTEDGMQSLPFQEFWAGANRPASGGAASPLAGKWASVESFTLQAREDLKALIPHLLLPWDEIKSFRWLQNRKFIA